MSNMYAIKDTTLTALGDAIRGKSGVSRVSVEGIELSQFDTSIDTDDYNFTVPDNALYYKYIIDVKVLNGENARNLYCYEGDNHNAPVIFKEIITDGSDFTKVVELSSSKTIRFYYATGSGATDRVSINITAIPLDENGHEYKYTPLEMAEAVNELDAIPSGAFNITGNCLYRFSNNNWNWFIEDYGDKITTNNIADASFMFYASKQLKTIPFDINLTKAAVTLESMFSSCSKLEEVPNVSWTEMPASTVKISRLFGGCSSLKIIPEWFIQLAEHNFNTAKSKGSWTDFGPFSGLFTNCESIREIPERLMAVLWNPVATGSYYTLAYSNPFDSMFRLNELVNIRYEDVEFTSNQFSYAFSNLQHIKRFTIATNEDGSSFIRKWKNQTFDLISKTGYGGSGNCGNDKKVKDDATYQALKNDPDWWSEVIEYSRYNHDSAVETINSLPDTSAYLAEKGGTNTIKFKGASGSLTDGGAINTLTEEEIAVAIAKGWTVSIV